jgi:hypothetical protein
LNLLDILHSGLGPKGLSIQLAQLYGSFEDIENRTYNYLEFKGLESLPTALYVLSYNCMCTIIAILTIKLINYLLDTASVGNNSFPAETYQFRTEHKASTPIPVPFQMLLCQSERVMSKVLELSLMELQCLHISQALRHLIVTLVNSGRRGPEQLYASDDLQR